ncbi:helix-turn-helix domain-containing protein [Bdellovibrio bacteriovorus]|uniref:helix-turn-helix domain-containing protein n=1 Tax=Bdellovibrio bacteriovorus TaxID=959 RepID=UPI0021D0DD29|nr:helix-turn-helix transcriptional regulator [Bdellovibrio bacteriovorus]UXR66083.1 helix-turn-helix domain-containing protein [Bdellovibrio bacteriovorus]
MKIEEAKIKTSLKNLMKEQGLQYDDLAKKLRVSTATVKRRLNKGELSISDLSDIASCLGTSFYDLVELSKNNTQKAYLFTEEQEKLFAGDLNYLLLFRSIVMGLNFTQLKEYLGLKESELRKKLRHLEEVELIQLMPRDRIYQLARFPFKWREDGLLQKAYHQKNLQSIFRTISTRYKSSTYDEDTGTLCKPFELLLTPEQRKIFSRELTEVLTKYQNLSRLELNTKNLKGVTVSGIIHADNFSIWDAN